MPYLVYIRKNNTGEMRVSREDYDWRPDAGSAYLWRDGNYSCDCNRSLFFYRAHNEEEPDGEHECGDTRFSVRITDLDGNELYEDDQW